jgi:hypothetical protein
VGSYGWLLLHSVGIIWKYRKGIPDRNHRRDGSGAVVKTNVLTIANANSTSNSD